MDLLINVSNSTSNTGHREIRFPAQSVVDAISNSQFLYFMFIAKQPRTKGILGVNSITHH